MAEAAEFFNFFGGGLTLEAFGDKEGLFAAPDELCHPLLAEDTWSSQVAESTVAALDRYQAAWAAALADPPRALLPVGDADLAEGRLRAWDERLSAAAELAASVGKQLDVREAAVGRWRELFADWHGVIQRGI